MDLLHNLAWKMMLGVVWIEGVENALNEGGIDTNAWHMPAPEGETVEMTADVAVVGGGFAGMVSAVRAAEQGAHVVLLERSGQLGGNARFAMGWISGAGFDILSCGNAWMPTKDADWAIWNDLLASGDLIVKA